MHLIQLIKILTIHMPIIFSSDEYFLQEYFPSIAIKIHAVGLITQVLIKSFLIDCYIPKGKRSILFYT